LFKQNCKFVKEKKYGLFAHGIEFVAWLVSFCSWYGVSESL